MTLKVTIIGIFDKIKMEISQIYYFKYKIRNLNTIKEENISDTRGLYPGRLGKSPPL